MLVNIICAFIGTIAFSHLFNVPTKHYFYCGLVGTMGYICYCILDIYTVTTFSTFVATMVVVLGSRIFAVWRKCPITVFLISGIFPLVPGFSVYNTAYYFVTDNLDEAVVWGINSLKIAFAIVLGIVFIVSVPKQFFSTNYWRARRSKKKVVS